MRYCQSCNEVIKTGYLCTTCKQSNELLKTIEHTDFRIDDRKRKEFTDQSKLEQLATLEVYENMNLEQWLTYLIPSGVKSPYLYAIYYSMRGYTQIEIKSMVAGLKIHTNLGRDMDKAICKIQRYESRMTKNTVYRLFVNFRLERHSRHYVVAVPVY